MTTNFTQGERYLLPPNQSFWTWTSDGRLLTWRDGTTIAFREEVEIVLQRLAKEGLAPFDMVVLLLAVCRNSWVPDANQINMLTEAMGSRSKMRQVQWGATLGALDKIASLPEEMKSSPLAKAELISLVLERHMMRTSPEQAEEVLRALKQGFPADVEVVDEIIKSTGEWIRELRGLSDGAQWVDAETLRLRLLTGLDELPLPVEESEEIPEQPRPVSVRELLKELESDRELGGMAKLARQLMGVVHLPRSIQDQDDLPLGGVSDISNRGPLDRLLISELANDDDTLMTRVALKEALYLRRETTVSNPPQCRKIFLDSGLRMWGVPRVFAMSVALSLAATTEQVTQLYRAAREDVDGVDFLSRDGLVDHFSRLAIDVHPGESLPAFAELIDPDFDEVVYVVGEDVFADVEFRRLLRTNSPESYFVATVQRDGRFRLLAYSAKGERQVREAQLDLNVLSGESEKRVVARPLIDESVNPDYPAILRLQQFPLRLSHGIDWDRAIEVKGPSGDQPKGLLTFAHDRRLMWWDTRDRGAIQLRANIHSSGEILCSKQQGDHLYLVVGQRDDAQRMLIQVNTETMASKVTPLLPARRPSKDVAIHAGQVMLIFKGKVHFYVLETGEFIQEFRTSPYSHCKGRFYGLRDPISGVLQRWSLSYDGISGRLEHLTDVATNVDTIFDSEACNGPVLIHSDELVQIPPEQPFSIEKDLPEHSYYMGASPDGDELYFQDFMATDKVLLYSLRERRFVELQANPPSSYPRRWYPAPWLRQPPPWQHSVRTRFSAISFIGDSILLRTTQGTFLNVYTKGDQLQLHRLDPPNQTELTLLRKFGRSRRVKGARFKLREAAWEDGSRAWLDSRGLLHLRNSDSRIPEVTLVLCDQNVSGWCSDGTVFGDPYFLIDGYPTVPAKDVFQKILRPFSWGLR